jgi:hypothetical protein
MAIDQTAIDAFYTETLNGTSNPLKATGTITLSQAAPTTLAARATGTVTFSGQPSDNDTVTFNGVAITFKSAAGASPEIQIGADLATTIATMVSVLNASANASLAIATYTGDATHLYISHDAPGTGGNSITLAKSGTNISVSGATLSGGVAGSTLTVNGTATRFLASGQAPLTGYTVCAGTAALTASALATMLNASADANIDDATYTANGAIVTVEFDTGGTAGNSFTLATNATGVAVSGATLSGGAAQGPAGPFNVSGTNDGVMVSALVDETWEDNVIALIGLIDATIALSQDPTADITLARRQRKLVKDVLQSMSAKMDTVSATTNNRTTLAAAVRSAGISEVNRFWRPATL